MKAEDFFTRYDGVIREVARKAASSHPGIEADDVAQEVRLAFLENPADMEACADQPALVSHVAGAKASRYCAGERYAYTFHSAQFVYTPDEVRALLEESFYDPASWEDAPTKEVDHRLNVAGGGVVVALWDLCNAFDKLGPSIQDSIRKRYSTPDELSATERSRVSRGIEQMTRTLNRFIAERSESGHDGPGARKVISNAQAQSITKNNA